MYMVFFLEVIIWKQYDDFNKKNKTTYIVIRKHVIHHFFWLCWGLTTRQPLRVILCRLPEKGRKEIEERVEEMKEGQGRKRNRNESEETEEIKTFPLYPYPLQG